MYTLPEKKRKPPVYRLLYLAKVEIGGTSVYVVCIRQYVRRGGEQEQSVQIQPSVSKSKVQYPTITEDIDVQIISTRS